MLLTGLVTLRVVAPQRDRDTEVLAQQLHKVRIWNLPDHQRPSGIAELAQLNGEPQPILLTPPLLNNGEVGIAQCVVLEALLAVGNRHRSG